MPETGKLGTPSAGRLIVITGPAGVGKTTLVEQVCRQTGACRSVSVATRLPRSGEMGGRDYQFIDRPTFARMIEEGGLLEWAEVFGNYYGTPLAAVREAIRSGKTIILTIDVQGGIQVHRLMPEATFVLVLPPTEEELSRRLNGRGTDTPDVIARRLAKAQAEIAAAQASGAYKHTVINDDLDRAVRQVVDIVEGRT